MKDNYDIFLSYRRDGGEATAKILRDKLTEAGYRVFLDVESLRSGDFNTELYRVIDGCRDFLIVLSPGALDRCDNEEDFVRLELEYALGKNKNIIPVILRGFTFPETLPDSIAPLRYKNGVESNYQFFDAFMEKLTSFLTSNQKKKGRRLTARRKWLFVLAFLVVAAIGGLAVSMVYRGRSSSYPRTEEEKNVTETFLYYIELNLQQIEQAADYLNDAYYACNQYLDHGDSTSRDSLLTSLQSARRSLYQMDLSASQMSDSLNASLADSPFSLADAVAAHDYLVTFRDSCLDDIYYLEYMTDPDNYVEKQEIENILDCYQEILEQEMESVACATNQMLLPVTEESALKAFKYEFLPTLYFIPLSASGWEHEEEVLKSEEEKCWNFIERSMDKINLQIGNTHAQLMESRAELIRQMVEEGTPEEEARALVETTLDKADNLTLAKVELQDAKRELEEKKNEARVKFAPDPADEPGILWGKMRRFLTLGLYDEAVKCLDYYREAVAGSDEYAQEYCSAMVRFIDNIPETGINYGLVVAGYEQGVPRNEQYRIGDIIISVNGTPCHDYSEYSDLRDQISEDENYNVVVLRADTDGSGSLKRVELEIPASASRVMILETIETTGE